MGRSAPVAIKALARKEPPSERLAAIGKPLGAAPLEGAQRLADVQAEELYDWLRE